ncbi:non-muscle caldesmon isoform X1 [Clupea harengus]|uniref:Non-muscle caldesmon isoform X1 n=1 Tax=Clupea harengus TaxID=7950 RepID=A0A6P3W2S9_CLUHA|nr:non-muscle caldesmon isoform X1 [Clupea harengus]
MSGAPLLRRNSSKQGLQNLLRVTAQRSIEDAEEIERERRRRAREAWRKEHGLSATDGPSLDTEPPAEATQSAQNYASPSKTSGTGALEEDEGFSDWTQRLGQERKLRLENGRPAEPEAAERGVNGAAKHTEKMRCASSATTTTTARLQRSQQDREENHEEVGEEEDVRLGSRMSEKKRKEFGRKEHHQTHREVQQKSKDVVNPIKKRGESEIADVDEKMKKKEVMVSYTSKVLVQHDAKPRNSNEDISSVEETASHVIRTKKTLRSPSQAQAQAPRDEEGAYLETEQKLEKFRRSHQEKESQELEQLKQKQAEAEAELEELKTRREQRRRVREEEERKKEEEEQQRLAKEEEERRHMKEEIERRRMEAAEKRMKSMNTSSLDGEELFNPLNPKSPTVKRENEERLTAESTYLITARTESLNRSLKKSNSFKKTQPPLLLSKIDDKLEQYTHAVESSSKEAKPAKAAVMEVLSPPTPVASTKSLFEAGEAWAQNAPRGQPSKDTEGIKVGVADLITNWVKGNPDGSNRNPSRPADVKPGDVLHKKNMWEVIGENSSGRPGLGGKGLSPGKKYKFVVTGHGKYEKIPMDDDNYSDFSNGKTGELCHDDF